MRGSFLIAALFHFTTTVSASLPRFITCSKHHPRSMKIDSRIPLCLTSNTTATSLPQRKSVLLRSHYTMNGPKNHGGEHSFQREPQSNSGGDNYFAASGVSAATASRDDFKILAASLITGLVNTLEWVADTTVPRQCHVYIRTDKDIIVIC